MGNSDFENPEIWIWAKPNVSKGTVIVGRVGELRETVTGQVHIELPAPLFGQGRGVLVQLLTRDVLFEPGLADVLPDRPGVLLGPVVVGVVSEDERVTSVAFASLVDRTDVDKEDVVVPENDLGLRT